MRFPTRTVFGRRIGASVAVALAVLAACRGDSIESAPMPRHQTFVQDAPALAGGVADSASSPIRSPFPFEELLVSWNVDRPEKGAFAVDVSVIDESGIESPWLEVGVGGAAPATRERVIAFERGRIDIDWFRAESGHRFVAAKARLRSFGPHSRLERLAFCFTARDHDATSDREAPLRPADLAVPFLSQRSAREELRGRICSPTSIAMVLAYRGIATDPESIAMRVYDADHDVYGNWPRSIQVAYEAGCPSYLTRFSSWDEVARAFAANQPIIASIGVEPGQLTGAPYETTSGHLIVLRGFDAHGDVLVNDPAAGDETRGRVVYSRRELETVWMRRGGTAYVIEPKRAEEVSR